MYLHKCTVLMPTLHWKRLNSISFQFGDVVVNLIADLHVTQPQLQLFEEI